MDKQIAITFASISLVFSFLFSTVGITDTNPGLTIDDAGKASCEGTYGGGHLSKEALEESCRAYKARTFGMDDVLYGGTLLLVGGAIGGLLTYGITRKKRK